MIRSIPLRTHLSVTALALAGSLMTLSIALSPAYAGAAAAPALEVKVGDLDLDKPAGVAVLYERLQFAARKVCGPSSVTGSRLSLREQRSCVISAVDNAVHRLDKPALTAYHQAHASDTQKT